MLIDRMQDLLRVLGCMFFPGREWIAACYAVECPPLVTLYFSTSNARDERLYQEAVLTEGGGEFVCDHC